MFKPRKTSPLNEWHDPDELKIYTISASHETVDYASFLPELENQKRSKSINWKHTAAFSIFHEGSELKYLVIGWWGNDNELFTSVSVKQDNAWINDSNKYSFCIWDLEVIWHERNSFIRHMYTETPNIEAYRKDRYHV